MNPLQEDAAEAQLVDRARAGDAMSFEILFERYYTMIHAFAFRVCFVETEADDIAQETFIRAARGLSEFRGKASFKNWLYRIAHNVVTDWLRHVGVRNRRQAGLIAATEENAQVRPADFGPVHAALSELPPAWRETVVLIFFDEMSHAEAARVLGCAETTVSWRIFRAKRLLKRHLRPEESS